MNRLWMLASQRGDGAEEICASEPGRLTAQHGDGDACRSRSSRPAMSQRTSIQATSDCRAARPARRNGSDRPSSARPGVRMPTRRSPGTTPSGETSTSVLKSSLASAALRLGRRPSGRRARGSGTCRCARSANQPSALSATGRSILLAPRRLHALDLGEFVAERLGADLALADGDQQFALARRSPEPRPAP